MRDSALPSLPVSHKSSRNESVAVRGLRYNVRHWGEEGAPRVFFLHGWMDSSPTFQFIVDALAGSWHIIAPDWRGYGGSEQLSRPYWFPDYYADLDCLLQHYSPDVPARIVGHSMGANIAATYAAVRPARVERLAMLDFLGLKPPADADAPTLLGQWLTALESPPRLRAYKDTEALARQLRLVNPRLGEARSRFLAEQVSRRRNDGTVEMACDPWHKIPSPTPYHAEDAMTSWRRIEVPVLLLVAERGFVRQRFGNDTAEYQRRVACFARGEVRVIEDAGHNLQHDQPERVAAELERFLG